MKKTVVTKSQVIKHIALSLFAGAALVFASSAISAESNHASSGVAVPATPVVALYFPNASQSGGESRPVQTAITYFGGLLLAAFLVGAHARAVTRKKNGSR